MDGEVKIGTAGWSYKDWEGVVYPSRLAPQRASSLGTPRLKREQHPVEFLARYFDVLEINTSFYGHIKPDVGLLWCRKAREANPGFVFTAKLNRAFTHSPVAVVEPTSAATLKPAPEDERLAKEGLDAVAGQGMLGALLAQFPISFKNTPENQAYLEKLVARFRDYPLAVEVRHASWNSAAALERLTQQGVAFCNIDQPQLGRAIQPTEHVTSPIGYVRLHGRNYHEWFSEGEGEGGGTQRRDARYNYLYKPKELEGWKGHIDRIRQRARVTFVVTNNHYVGKAAVNALQLKNMLTGRRVKVPPTLSEHYPELESIAESDDP